MTDTPQPDPWTLDALKDLAEIALSAARALGRRVEAAAEAGEDVSAPVMALSRASRIVRLSIALHDRLRREPPRAARATPADAPADAPDDPRRLADRRRQGELRRAMAHFIARTAIEAEDRAPAERERLTEALSERLDRERADLLDFEHVDVKALAYELATALGVDPGPDWWLESWGLEVPAPEDLCPETGRTAPVPKGREPGAPGP